MFRTSLPSLAEAASPLRDRIHIPSALKYPGYRNYWLGLLASVTGYQMLLLFSLGWLITSPQGLDKDARFLGYMGLAAAIPGIILTLFGGVLADKFNPKRLMGICQFTTALVVAGLATVVAFDVVMLWHALLLAFLIGAIQAFDAPSRQSVWPHLIDRKVLPNAVVLNSVIWTGTRIVAPAMAGVIIGRTNIATAIFISAAGFLILSLVSRRLKLPPLQRAKGRVMNEMLEGFLFIKSNPIFSFLIGMSFFNSMFGMSYILLMPIFAKEVLEVGPEKLGWLFGVSGIGSLLGTVVAGNLGSRLYNGKMLIGGAVLFGGSLILFALLAHLKAYELSMVALFVSGASNSLYLMTVLTNLQARVPNQFRGRIMGFYTITWSVMPLGALQAGFLAHYTNPSTAVAVGGGLVIAFALGPALANRSIRSLAAPTEVRH